MENNNILGAAMRQLALLSHVVNCAQRATSATTVAELDTVLDTESCGTWYAHGYAWLLERDTLALLYLWDLLPASILAPAGYYRGIAWEDVLERAEQPWPFIADAPERLGLRSWRTRTALPVSFFNEIQ